MPEQSELLKLLDQRKDERHSVPDLKGQEAQIERAIRLHADAHKSDPFAALQIRHAITKGYTLLSDVLHDATKIIEQREQRKEGLNAHS